MRKFYEPRDGEPVDDCGLPIRVHYLLIGLIAFSIGAITLLFALTPQGEPLRHPSVVVICIVAIAIPAIFYAYAKRTRNEFSEQLVMAVLLLAVIGPLTWSFFIGELLPAFLTLFMLGPIGVAYYMPLRRGWPVIAMGAAAILYVSYRIDEPDAMARGAVVLTITLASSLMLSAIRGHLSRTVESNREISERDPLTGAFNLHKFHEQLAEHIERSESDGEGFALVEIDLDEFGAVNEQYGRKTGDEVLVAAAEAIQSTLTPWDLLVRRNADQFVVIAPFIPSRNLHATTLLARDRVAAARRAICPDLRSSACAGWALHKPAETAGELIDRADDALFESKRAARLTGTESLVWRDLRETQAGDRREAHAGSEVIELRRRRAEEAAIGDDPMAGAMRIAWRTAAYSTIALSVALLIMGLTGQLSFDLTAAHYALFFGWVCVMAPLALWVTAERRAAFVDHILCVGGLTMTMLTCLVAGDAAPAMLEMFMMCTLLFFTLLPFRYALGYVFVAYAFYAAFLYANSYPTADMRIATTLVNFAFVGAILALSRNSAIEAANEKAIRARTDALTGLANERRLHSWLAAEIERCEQDDEMLALLAVNLDDFKAVNDLYGHSAGDELLIAVAQALSQAARSGDLAARRGGDEFVLVMAGADDIDAAAAASQIADAARFARARIAPDLAASTTITRVAWRSGDSADELIDLVADAIADAKNDVDGDHPRHLTNTSS